MFTYTYMCGGDFYWLRSFDAQSKDSKESAVGTKTKGPHKSPAHKGPCGPLWAGPLWAGPSWAGPL